MTTLPLLHDPAVVLHTPTQEVGDHIFDAEVQQLIEDMLDTVTALSRLPRGCAGLAANQVGSLWRVCIVNVVPNQLPLVMVDPQITRRVNTRRVFEGCLSVKMQRDTFVARSKIVGVKWRAADSSGHAVGGARDFLAQAIEHEVDHLDGHLFYEKEDLGGVALRAVTGVL